MGLSEIKPEHRIFFLRYFIEEIFATSYEEYRIDNGLEKISYNNRNYDNEGFVANFEKTKEEDFNQDSLRKTEFVIVQKNDLPKNLNETKYPQKNIGELRKSIVLRQKYPSANNFSKGRQIMNQVPKQKIESPKPKIIEQPFKQIPTQEKIEKEPPITKLTKSEYENNLENLNERVNNEPKKEYFSSKVNQNLRPRPVQKIYHPIRKTQLTPDENMIQPSLNFPPQNNQPAPQPPQQPMMQPIIIQMPPMQQYPNQPMYPNQPIYQNMPQYPNMQGQMPQNQPLGPDEFRNTSNISEGGYEQSIAGAGPEKLTQNLPTDPAKKVIPMQINFPQIQSQQQVREIKFVPPPSGEVKFTGTESGLKKIEFLMKDPAVQIIECPGPGKNVNIKRHNKMMATKVILSQQQIIEIINEYSTQARIPLVGGILKAAVGNSVISAVVSEFVGGRFMINKLTPYSILYGKN
jgi:hypothetical protein